MIIAALSVLGVLAIFNIVFLYKHIRFTDVQLELKEDDYKYLRGRLATVERDVSKLTNTIKNKPKFKVFDSVVVHDTSYKNSKFKGKVTHIDTTSPEVLYTVTNADGITAMQYEKSVTKG